MEPYGISTGFIQTLNVYKVERALGFVLFFSPNYFHHLTL
jgi:hypothetical protein